MIIYYENQFEFNIALLCQDPKASYCNAFFFLILTDMSDTETTPNSKWE